MSIFHCAFKIINRASGRSAVSAAAYRAAEKLHNYRDGVTYDYSKKKGVAYREVLLPPSAPKEFANRQTLWNEVESVEKRKDAQTAREVELALPKELSRPQQIALVKNYLQENFISEGMCADLAIHDKADGNPHAHVMLTVRRVNQNGFGNKERSWNERANIERWREQWATTHNQTFATLGFKERVDHRSFKRQGIELEPTIHLGTTANQLEKRGIVTERGDLNRQIKSKNIELQTLTTQITYFNQKHRATLAKTRYHLGQVQDRYISTSLKLHNQQEAHRSVEEGVTRLLYQSQDLTRRAQIISTYNQNLEQMRPAANLDAIIHLEKSRQQAIFSLARDYNIQPEQALSQAHLLRAQAQAQLQAYLPQPGKLLTLDNTLSPAAIHDYLQTVQPGFDWLLQLLERLAEKFLQTATVLFNHGVILDPHQLTNHLQLPTLSAQQTVLQAQNQLFALLTQAQPQLQQSPILQPELTPSLELGR
jgi:hypothetical protein